MEAFTFEGELRDVTDLEEQVVKEIGKRFPGKGRDDIKGWSFKVVVSAEMKEEHKCTREDLEWDNETLCDDDSISYIGRCPVCGKVYEQVFKEVKDGLWDKDEQEYVQI